MKYSEANEHSVTSRESLQETDILHNYNAWMHLSFTVIGITKSRLRRPARHAVGTEEIRNTYKMPVRTLYGMRPFVICGYRLEDDIKVSLREMGCDSTDSGYCNI
jgi:hypothetical protein